MKAQETLTCRGSEETRLFYSPGTRGLQHPGPTEAWRGTRARNQVAGDPGRGHGSGPSAHVAPREPRPLPPCWWTVAAIGSRLRSHTSALQLQCLLRPAGSLGILHPDVKLLGLVRPDSSTHGPPSFAMNEVLYYSREKTPPRSQAALCSRSLPGAPTRLDCFPVEMQTPLGMQADPARLKNVYRQRLEAPHLLFGSFANEALKSFCSNVVFLIRLIKQHSR